jgi:hypothetical protein
MMDDLEIQPWFFQVEPYEGESISHFLGRFRRANELTPGGLGQMAGLGAAIGRWEKFRFNPRPTGEQLEKLAVVVGVPTERLWQMLPGDGVGMKMEPIRLCGACYGEVACHRIEWQLKETSGCDRHQLRLLSECPTCGARFSVPASWVEGNCKRCFTPFSAMAMHQKSIA